MMIDYWLVLGLLLFLSSSADGKITDKIFDIFCKSDHLAFPGGLEPAKRVGNETCTQIVPGFSELKWRRRAICRKSAPYTVISADEEGKGTKCTWAVKYKCRGLEMVFHKKCLRLIQSVTFDQFQKQCGDEMYRAGDIEETRWLIKLFAPGQSNVWIANSPEHWKSFMPRLADIGYIKSNFDYGSNYKHLSIMANNDWEVGINMGIWIPTDEKERLKAFCSRPARRIVIPEGSSTLPDNETIPAASNMKVYKIDKDLSVFLTSPFVFSKVQSKAFTLDVEEMHRECKKFSSESFVLIPSADHLNKYADFLDSPVFVVGFMATPSKFINGCGRARGEQQVLAKQFHTHDKNKRGKVIDPQLWEKDFPQSRCSKQASVAVVLNANGRLENFPASARLPIICGLGVQPEVPDIEMCTMPNSQLGPDGKCRCVPGTTDLLDTQLPGSDNYERGFYCRPKHSCTTKETSLIFYLLVDQSGSVGENNWKNHIVPFSNELIQRIYDETNGKAVGGIIRFATGTDVHFVDRWDVNDLRSFMAKRYVGGNTALGRALQSVVYNLSKRRITDKTRIVTVVMSDGKDTVAPHKVEPNARALKSYANSTVIVFSLGARGLDKNTLEVIATNPMTHIFKDVEFSKISNYFADLMVQICPPLTLGDFKP